MTAVTQNNRQHTPFYWHLMDYEGVKISDVVVYGYLRGWQNSANDPNSKVKRVFPSLDRIGSDLRISSKSVGRSVALLEKLGFLIKERPNRRMSYLYTVVELDDLPSVAPAAKPQGPADEHTNDSSAQNDVYQSSDDQDQTTGDYRRGVEPVTALEWLDAAFLPDGELKQVAVQYCLEHGVTDPEEQKYLVRKLVNPDYVREKPIYNPTPATASEPEDIPF